MPVRVALVGYGTAGRLFHGPFIEATAGTELVAVVTADADRRRQASAAHPGAALVETTAALWAAAGDLGVELVVVATPNRSHVPVALAALHAGLAVVVDKPLAASAKEGARVVGEAARRGLVLSVFHNRRWDGDFLTVRHLVDIGALGEVHRFESRFERWRPGRPGDAWRDRADPRDGGGVLADLGSHVIDQAVVLLGPPVSIYAELRRLRPGAEVDDDAFVAIEHHRGSRSHLWASSLTARPGPRFRVLGSHAGYVVSGMDPQEEALRAGAVPGGAGWGATPAAAWGTVGAGDDVVPVPTEAGNYGRFYEGMAASVRHGEPPPVESTDGLLTLAIIDAARRSATVGRPVPFTA